MAPTHSKLESKPSTSSNPLAGNQVAKLLGGAVRNQRSAPRRDWLQKFLRDHREDPHDAVVDWIWMIGTIIAGGLLYVNFRHFSFLSTWEVVGLFCTLLVLVLGVITRMYNQGDEVDDLVMDRHKRRRNELVYAELHDFIQNGDFEKALWYANQIKDIDDDDFPEMVRQIQLKEEAKIEEIIGFITINVWGLDEELVRQIAGLLNRRQFNKAYSVVNALKSIKHRDILRNKIESWRSIVEIVSDRRTDMGERRLAFRNRRGQPKSESGLSRKPSVLRGPGYHSVKSFDAYNTWKRDNNIDEFPADVPMEEKRFHPLRLRWQLKQKVDERERRLAAREKFEREQNALADQLVVEEGDSDPDDEVYSGMTPLRWSGGMEWMRK